MKNGIIAAVIGALSIAGAAPAQATTDAELCRIMGPQYVEGVRECVCIVVVTVGTTVLPGSQWMCEV